MRELFANVGKRIVVDGSGATRRRCIFGRAGAIAIVVIVRIVVIGVTFDLLSDRVTSAPYKRVAAIPVIANVPVANWPVAA